MAWFSAPDPFAFRCSARTELRFWVLLLIGLVFCYASFTIEPASNCSSDGECAPWLVPLAGLMGLGATAIALGTLLANPKRGMMIDPATGELVWWQNGTTLHGSDGGRIAPADIARIVIRRDSEGDELHLYDRAGERLPYFDTAVIRGTAEQWAGHAAARWPHIAVEIKG